MKTLHYYAQVTLLSFAWFGSIGALSAANFTTQVTQPGGQNWNATIWQPGGVAPIAGNTYELIPNGTAWGNNTANTRIRNPAAAGVQTFPGDSLTLNTNTDIRMKQSGAILNFPGVNGQPGLILNGGVLNPGDDAAFTVTGNLLVKAPSIIAPADNGGGALKPLRAVIIAGVLNGTGSLRIVQGDPNGVAQEVTSTDNPFSGNWIVDAGFLKGSGNNSLGSGSIIISPTNNAIVGSKLEVNYDINTAGSLTLSNGGLMVLHQNCTFTGVTIEGTALSLGLHDYTELSASFPANFAPGGSGSITVILPSPPPAPAGLTAVNGDGQVSLSWGAAARAASYNIKRSDTSGGPYTTIGTATSPGFVDTGLVNGSAYYYVVSGVNDGGEGPDSTEVSARPSIAVTGLTATGGTGQVALHWDSFGGALNYKVKRAIVSGGPYTTVASGVAGNSYTDTTALSGRTYFYVVSANLAGGLESSDSNEASATTSPGAPVLTATLFAATVTRVGWATDPVVTQILLEQSVDGVNFDPLATLPPNQGSTNANLTASTTYSYRAKAQNDTGISGYSTVVSVTTPAFGINVDFGSAPNNSAGTPPSAPAPGYLLDVGNVFGDRGNGYSYGWDRDITADGRYRQSPNSPDVRYDTFVHLLKATPAAFWEIEIPNGYYKVRIVAGDPNNIDSVFQFNVEGSITPTYIPVAGAWWGDFTVNAAVSDGRLTVMSGPRSVTTTDNNKIAFIDIYPDVPVAPSITGQPQGGNVEESHPFTLTATVTGSPLLTYQWYLEGNPIPDATGPSLAFPHIQATDAGHYSVVVTNYGGSAVSDVATVTVFPDTTAPSIVSVASLDGVAVGVRFSEEMSDALSTLHDNLNYTVTSAAGDQNPIAAVVRPGSAAVALTLANPISGPFTLTVSDSLIDVAGNPISPSGKSRSSVVGGYFAGDVGGPAFPGSHYTDDGNTISIVGGGADEWGNSDQMYLLSHSTDGDFDTRVKVVGLQGSNTITKAALVVREDTTATARALHISVNPPPPGRDQLELGLRAVTGDVTAGWGGSFIPAGIPNTWMRITRVGNLFNGYRSTNGTDWVFMGQTNLPLPSTLAVGLAVTAHDNTLLATGLFSNFKIVGQPTAAVPRVIGGTFSASILTAAGFLYRVEYKDDLNAPGWSLLTTLLGDGSVKTFTDTSPPPATGMRVYRILLQ